MRKILLAVDGPREADAAVRYLLAHRWDEPLEEVHLVNVQPEFRGYVCQFLGKAARDDFRREEGEKALDPARRRLDEAQVAYTSQIRIGEDAEVIAEAADEFRVDEIVVGADGLGLVGRLMVQLLVTRLIGRVRVPVRVVKSSRSAPMRLPRLFRPA